MARIKNMGHSTVRFNEGVIISGSAGSDTKTLIVTGSMVLSGSASKPAIDIYSNVSGQYVAIIDNDEGSNGHGLKVTTDGTGTGTTILDLEAGTSTVFKVRGDGRVGIGVGTPLYELDVDGKINSSDDLYVSGNLYVVDTAGLYVDKIRRHSDSDNTTKILLNDELLKFYAGHSSDDIARIGETNYGNDNNFWVSGSIGSKDSSTRGTAVLGGDVVTSGSMYIEGDIYLGPPASAATRLYHAGNTDTYFAMYSNDSFEFVIGGINYLKMKEGATDWIEFNKNNADVDFKLWGTNDSNPAIFLNAGEESLRFNAGLKANVSEIGDGSFPYTVDARDYLITCAGSGARTINLPAVANESGRILIIKDSNGSSGAGNITLDPSASEQIDASATYAIGSNRESVTIMCDGVGWAIISRYQP